MHVSVLWTPPRGDEREMEVKLALKLSKHVQILIKSVAGAVEEAIPLSNVKVKKISNTELRLVFANDAEKQISLKGGDVNNFFETVQQCLDGNFDVISNLPKYHPNPIRKIESPKPLLDQKVVTQKRNRSDDDGDEIVDSDSGIPPKEKKKQPKLFQNTLSSSNKSKIQSPPRAPKLATSLTPTFPIQRAALNYNRPRPLPRLGNISPKHSETHQSVVKRPESPLPYPQLRSTGMRNLGNTCYMNAVLQALVSLPTFVADILSPEWQAETKKVVIDFTKPSLPLFRSFEDILHKTISLRSGNSNVPIDPSPFKEAVGNYATKFSGNAQQDAHELLLDSFECFDEELLPLARNIIPKKPVVKALVNVLFDEDTAEEGEIEKTTTPIAQPWTLSPSAPDPTISPSEKPIETQEVSKIIPPTAVLPTSRSFHSVIDSTITCKSCKYQRVVKEEFRTHSLSLPEYDHSLKSKINLDNLLRNDLQAEETIELRCDKCGSGTEATVTKKLSVIPEILILHVKRFELRTSDSGIHFDKRNDEVIAPLRLKLGKDCFSSTHVRSFYRMWKSLLTVDIPLPLMARVGETKEKCPPKPGGGITQWLLPENNSPSKPDKVIITKSLPSDHKVVYDLRCIVLHKGRGIQTGHYTAAVRTSDISDSDQSVWSIYNDSRVQTNAPDSEILDARSREGFLYFYELVNE